MITYFQVIQPEGDWWWGGWSLLSFIALVLNILFLIVIIKNRKNRDLRSLLTAVLITITVLDILDIFRIVPAIVLNLHKYVEFQFVYCSLGVFHAVAVAVLLIILAIYLVCPCRSPASISPHATFKFFEPFLIVYMELLSRDAPPLYYPESTCSGSLPQKLVIPLVLLVSGLAAGLMPLLPALHPTSSDIAWNTVLPHSCVDPTR